MKPASRLFAACALGVGLLVAPARAFNNSNLTFSGITTNLGTVLEWPGDSGTNNTLWIIDGAKVTDTAHYFGGINGAANRNFAIIAGSGSVWSNTGGNSFVGRYGGGNQVIVSNSGAWVSANALVGSLVASASNNSVLVTGLGSGFRTTGDTVLGGGGVSNQFTVADQGTASFATLEIGAVTVGNVFVVTNGGYARPTSTYVGSLNSTPAASDNLLLVSGPGSVFSNATTIVVGRYSPRNQLIINDGARVVSHGVAYIGGILASGSNNSALVSGSSSVFSNFSTLQIGNASANNQFTVDAGLVYAAALTVGAAVGGHDNTLLVTNGGRISLGGSLIVSDIDASTSNSTATVTGPGSAIRVAGNTLVGRYATGNQLIIADGGLVTNAIGYIGASSAGGNNNSVLVTGSGSTWSNSSLVVGNAGAANSLTISDGGLVRSPSMTVGNGTANNTVLVTNGGILEVNSQTVNSGLGNSVSNRGGVLQFTVATPSLSAGGVTTTNGVVSFHGITNASVASVANLGYLGPNTFRLNAASNALSGQSYTFDTNASYARVELVNGATAYRGGHVTIGSAGSFLGSNTQARISDVFTNAGGTVRFVNSVGTFSSAVVNNGAWLMDPSTNVFLSSYTLGSGGSASLGSGDLFEFQDHFVNTSAQSNTYNTVAGAFLFSGLSLTQQLHVAGKDLLSEAGYVPGSPTELAPKDTSGFNANFALGTLELSNAATVLVTDAFSILNGNNDSRRGALYLDELVLGANALLIVDSNVSVYFQSSSLAAGAGYVLLGDAGLHQFVPEPSVLFLLAAGAAVVRRFTRRR